MATVPAQIFKAYDVRGSTATTSTRTPPSSSAGRSYRPRRASPASAPRPAQWPRARHAADRAGAPSSATSAAWSRRVRTSSTPARSAPRCSISSSGRAAWMAGRAHRLAQPGGVHGREARPRGRDRAVRRLGHPGHAPAGRGGLRRRARRGLGRGRRHLPEFHESAMKFIDPANVKPMKVVVDGGNGMGGPMVGPRSTSCRSTS